MGMLTMKIRSLWDRSDAFRLICCIGMTAALCLTMFGLGTRIGEYFFHIFN
ncbi:MAG: hypothetical protein K6F49_10415 [Saccharofermentans sp.]|nr:hypothetical protein [Saccharofermentans sp.]